MKEYIGTLLIAIVFMLFTLAYIFGGMFGVMLFVLYMVAILCSISAFLIGLGMMRRMKWLKNTK